MINSKTRATLRKFAQTQVSVCQIGKGGLSPQVLNSVREALIARELIKVTVLESCEKSARELADELAEILKAEVIQVIGAKFVLYKKNPNIKSSLLI